jgi:hypothetical protein
MSIQAMRIFDGNNNNFLSKFYDQRAIFKYAQFPFVVTRGRQYLSCPCPPALSGILGQDKDRK